QGRVVVGVIQVQVAEDPVGGLRGEMEAQSVEQDPRRDRVGGRITHLKVLVPAEQGLPSRLDALHDRVVLPGPQLLQQRTAATDGREYQKVVGDSHLLSPIFLSAAAAPSNRRPRAAPASAPPPPPASATAAPAAPPAPRRGSPPARCCTSSRR